MCTLYVRCVLSVLQKEFRKVWGARYTLGACYRLENTVYEFEVFTAAVLRIQVFWDVMLYHLVFSDIFK